MRLRGLNLPLLDGIHLHLKAEEAVAPLRFGGVQCFVSPHQHGFSAGVFIGDAGGDAARESAEFLRPSLPGES